MKAIVLYSSLFMACFVTDMCHGAPAGTVKVGNPGNGFGIGSVDYVYHMGKTEVTHAQYIKFLNAVADSDPYGLYSLSMAHQTSGGIIRNGTDGNYSYSVKPPAVGKGPNGSDYTYGNKPVVYVSWFDAIRYTNWLHNGQGNGDTETGAYTLGELIPFDEFHGGGKGIPVDQSLISRNPGAKWFLLPSTRMTGTPETTGSIQPQATTCLITIYLLPIQAIP
jgi:formylglycine-generating enzyme